MGLFSLFKKQPEKAADPAALQAKGDFAGLSKLYFQMGKDALAQGDQDRARMWLGRGQAFTDASDKIYEKVGDAVIDEASDLLSELEEAPLLVNEVTQRVEEEFETLSGSQRWQWATLTFCRLQKLLEAAGALSGCEPLADTGAVIDALFAHFYSGASDEAWGRVEAYNDFLFQWADSPAYFDPRQEIPVSGGAPFQLLDLNGEIVPTELNLYMDILVNGRLSARQMEGTAPQAVLDSLNVNDYSGMARCALLSGYYLRTCGGKLDDMPQVQAEIARIWDDLEFVRTEPDREAVERRAAEYRKLTLPA